MAPVERKVKELTSSHRNSTQLLQPSRDRHRYRTKLTLILRNRRTNSLVRSNRSNIITRSSCYRLRKRTLIRNRSSCISPTRSIENSRFEGRRTINESKLIETLDVAGCGCCGAVVDVGCCGGVGGKDGEATVVVGEDEGC